MQTATRTPNFDLRRTLVCAALATITSLGMFSLVANLMTPLFAAIRWLGDTEPAQHSHAIAFRDTVCVQGAHREANIGSQAQVEPGSRLAGSRSAAPDSAI